MTRWTSSCSCPPGESGSCAVCADFADSPRGSAFVGGCAAVALLAVTAATVWSVVLLVWP